MNMNYDVYMEEIEQARLLNDKSVEIKSTAKLLNDILMTKNVEG